MYLSLYTSDFEAVASRYIYNFATTYKYKLYDVQLIGFVALHRYEYSFCNNPSI